MEDGYSGSVANAPQDTLLGALVKRKEVTKLTAISNNAGAGDSGLGLFYLHQSMIPWSLLHIYRKTIQQ